MAAPIESSSMDVNLEETIVKLQTWDGSVQLLRQLNAQLAMAAPNIIQQSFSEIQFLTVATRLITAQAPTQNTSSDIAERRELCQQIMVRLFDVVESSMLLQHFSQFFIMCLRHEQIFLREFALRQIRRGTVDGLCVGPTVIEQLIRLLSDDNLSVVKMASDVLVTCGSTSSQSTQQLFSEEHIALFQQISRINETIRFRVHEVVTRIAVTKAECIAILVSRGLLQSLVNELHTVDILVQLNCVQLMADLAETEHGLDFLYSCGVIDSMDQCLINADADPMMSLLLPGLIRFFGSVASRHPNEVLDRHRNFVTLVFDILTGGEEHVVIATDTIRVIGATPAGKLALHNQGAQFIKCMQVIGRMIAGGHAKTKSMALLTLAALIHINLADQSAELLLITQQWFNETHSKTLDLLVSISRQPFPDLRCSTLRVFKSMAALPWGQSVMAHHPGFPEYLLDRTTELEKEGKDCKYEVIDVLVNMPFTADHMGWSYLMRLKDVYKEGPYFIKSVSEVATEEAG